MFPQTEIFFAKCLLPPVHFEQYYDVQMFIQKSSYYFSFLYKARVITFRHDPCVLMPNFVELIMILITLLYILFKKDDNHRLICQAS